MILIKDGRVVDPASGLDETLDIVIEDGKISKIGKYQKTDDCELMINAKGLIVAPGRGRGRRLHDGDLHGEYEAGRGQRRDV